MIRLVCSHRIGSRGALGRLSINTHLIPAVCTPLTPPSGTYQQRFRPISQFLTSLHEYQTRTAIYNYQPAAPQTQYQSDGNQSGTSSSSSSGGSSLWGKLKMFGGIVVTCTVASFVARFFLSGPGPTTADETCAYLMELRRQDRLLPNYSPALEDRFEARGRGFKDEEYFAMPTMEDFLLLAKVSPLLAGQDSGCHLNSVSERARLFDDDGVREAAAKHAFHHGPVPVEESLELADQAKVDLYAGQVFLLGARMLNEFVASLRLQGRTDLANEMARKAHLRIEEAAMCLQATSDAFHQCVHSHVNFGEHLEVQNYLTEACMRKHDWKVTDELIAASLDWANKPYQDPFNDSAVLYHDLLKYQTLELQAESLQLRKRYQEAIPVWHQVIEQSKGNFLTAPLGVRDLTVMDFTNQLSHCYLQVKDSKRAWETYELGLELERIARDCLTKQESDDETQSWVREQATRLSSSRADADIIKNRILEANQGRIPE